MFADHTIKLDFSLLEEFATAASKQFKILERCMGLSINSELETQLKFPSKQLCLEIMAQGFGFRDYKAAKSDRQNEELRSFKLPDELLEKFFYRHNPDIKMGAGFYALMWLRACKRVFQNTFCLSHSNLNLYNEMNVAKFTNYALVYQVYPYCGLLSNAVGDMDSKLCESEDSLFLLNLIALIIENKEVKWSGVRAENGSEKTVQLKYKDIYRSKPIVENGRDRAMDYATETLFDADIVVFVCQIGNSANVMKSEYAIHFMEESYQALDQVKKVGRVMDWCKEALDEQIMLNPHQFGFSHATELNVKKNGKYRALYRRLLVAMDVLVQGTSNLTHLSERVFDYKTQSAVSKALIKAIKNELSNELVSL